MKLLILALIGGSLGAILASNGISVLTWQYWACFGLLLFYGAVISA